MAFEIFRPAYASIDAKLEQFLNESVSAVIAEVAPPLRLALVLYVLLYGFAILRGAITEPVMDFAVRSLKLAVIYLLGTSVAYGEWVAQPLFHMLPETLSRAINGGVAPEPGQAFDQFFARAAYLAQRIINLATPLYFEASILGAIVLLLGLLAAALGFGIVVLAKVALALLVAIGPIFVGCALFESTRRYFFGWLNQGVNYLVLFALVIAVLQLVVSMVGDQWASIDGQDPMVGGMLFAALCAVAMIFFLQTPALAAGIAGGASAGLADFATAGRAGVKAFRSARERRASS